MFKAKIKSISKEFLLIVLLALFVASQSVSVLHAFSHDEFSSIKSESFLAKVFAHNSEKSAKNKAAEHCSICSFANFHNQISASAMIIFAAAIFYLVFFTRKFDRVKASYFRTSNSSRAPPFNS